MRASVTSLSKKFLSTIFAATLALGLMPAAAFAAENNPVEGESQEEYTGEVSPSFDGEEAAGYTAETGEDSNPAILAAVERVNEDVALTMPVAQQESTRSYFLAQTLESTHTVPMLSANVPIGSEGQTAEESTVIGSFEYLGMTFAIEADGASVVLAAVDYSKLQQEFIEKQIIVVPDSVTPDGIDRYSVARIADKAFSSLKKGNADPAYVGCEALLFDEDLRAEAGIDIDFEDENPLAGYMGILAIGIPASVSTIEDDAFSGFETLQYIVASDDNLDYASYDGALYSADLSQLRLIPEGRLGAVCIAPNATEVLPEVFSHCPSVDTLVADADSAAYETLMAALASLLDKTVSEPEEMPHSFADATMNIERAFRLGISGYDSAEYSGSILPYGEMNVSSDADRAAYAVATSFETATSGVYFPDGVKLYISYTGLGKSPSDYTNFQVAVQEGTVDFKFASFHSSFTSPSVQTDSTYGKYIRFGPAASPTLYAWTVPAATSGSTKSNYGILKAAHKFTWDSQGATCSGGATSGTSGLWFPTSVTMPSGWSGGHWYEDSSFQTICRANTSSGYCSPAFTKDTTFYLRWTRKVTFEHQDKQSQTITTKTGVKKYATSGLSDTRVRIESAVSPSRDDGWTFEGWSTNDTSESPEIVSISTSASSPTWLSAYQYYGRWSKQLDFEANNERSLPSLTIWSSNVAPYGNKETASNLPTPHKNGYTFTGWYANEECTGDRLDDGIGSMAGKLKENAVVSQAVIYAGWSDGQTFETDFNENCVGFYYPNDMQAYVTYKKPTSGEADPDRQAASTDTIVEIDRVRYNRNVYYSGYNAGTTVEYDKAYGWYAVHTAAGTGKKVYAYTVPPAHDAKVSGVAAILYAGYDITFDGNGATVSNPDVWSHASNYAYYPTNVTGMDDWNSGGWYEDKQYTIPSRIQEDGRFASVLTKPLTLYLRWTRGVVFESQDKLNQVIQTATGVKDYGANVNTVKIDENIETPSRDDGWTFRGWSADVTSEAQGLMEITASTSLPAYHYYGRWSKQVSFESNGAGEFSPVTLWSSDEAPYGNKVSASAMPTPTKAGFIFTGWYADKACSGARVDDGSGAIAGNLKENVIVANGTLYAGWAPILSVTVPTNVTALVDLADVEEQVSGQGYIQSNSGGTLAVTQVDFEPFEGAEDMFGDDKGRVFLEARVESSSSTSPDLRFRLGATATEANPTKLAPFTLTGLNARKAITYRFDIPKEILLSIDSSAFQNKTTPLGKVAYTVAVAE